MAQKDRTKCTIERFGIAKNIEKFTRELQQVRYVGNIEYDLDSLIDNIPYIILIVEYNIPISMDNYYKTKTNFVNDILKVAQNNGLKKTEDSIEDYGQHYYFVFRHNNDWVHTS
ncbi:MAG: hypothetical protein J6N52_03665 [Clostridia bacterium]|nr:hypothetical protein [Clostridia bacterium]